MSRTAPRIIGLCGPEGAGKSTAAKILAEHYDYAVVPFAKPLKDMLEALGVPHENLWGTPAQKLEPLELLCGKTARHAMQALGTEYGRQFIGESLWVNAWRAAVDRAWQAGARGIVVDDMRFPNEVAAIKSLQGQAWCIVRSRHDFNRTPKHASEDFNRLERDAIIFNRTTIEEFAFKIGQRLPVRPRYFGPGRDAGRRLADIGPSVDTVGHAPRSNAHSRPRSVLATRVDASLANGPCRHALKG